MKNNPIVIEKTFNAPVAKVWNAITNKNEMKKWYFDIENFEPVIGFKFQFSGGSKEKTYLHLCEINQLIPYKKLAYSWRYDGYQGNSEVTFELFEEGNKTRLKLMHTGLESFRHATDFSKESFVGGWTQIIGNSLKKYLE